MPKSIDSCAQLGTAEVTDLQAHLLALERRFDEAQRKQAQVDTKRESVLGQLLAAQAAAHEMVAAANSERTDREQAHRVAEDRWL